MANSKQNITDDIKGILDTNVNRTETSKVPLLQDSYPTLNGNDGRFFTGSVLFVDMRGSTKLFDTHYDNVIAKIIMSYYKSIIDVVHNHDGEIRSFNGDSLLVFFHGNTKGIINKAVKCAMQIVYCINYILNPELEKKGYSKIDFGIGIDHGEILTVKVGKSGDTNKDLVRIAQAVNYSAKMGDTAGNPKHVFISSIAFNNLFDETRYHTKKDPYGREVKVDMWSYTTLAVGGKLLGAYSTSYYWTIK